MLDLANLRQDEETGNEGLAAAARSQKPNSVGVQLSPGERGSLGKITKHAHTHVHSGERNVNLTTLDVPNESNI